MNTEQKLDLNDTTKAGYLEAEAKLVKNGEGLYVRRRPKPLVGPMALLLPVTP